MFNLHYVIQETRMGHQFSSGQYYGTQSFERQVDEFQLKHVEATVPEHEVHEHSHEGAHVVLATKGIYLTSAAGEQRQGPALIYNPPGIIHRDRFQGDGGWFFALSLAPELSVDLIQHLHLPNMALRSHAKRSQQIAFSLLRMASTPYATRLDLETSCLQLLSSLTPDRALPVAIPPWLQQAKEMIADCSEDDLSIKQIADEVGVHRVYLSRQYVHHFACSPGDDLRRRRIERAAHLLMNSGDTLIEVAHHCGYCDQSHLHRAFIQYYGISPTDFRRLCSRKKCDTDTDKVTKIQDLH